VDMGEVTRSVAKRYQSRAADKNISLNMHGDKNLPFISGDPRALERALSALVDNAIKFSPNGGEVDLNLKAERDALLIKVEDHGIGISPNTQPHVFDRFYHLERHDNQLYGGIGLGLAIARQVIEQHNGSLEVFSTPGKGSTFTIKLMRRK
jgi:signal transduction histidine kinase